MFVLAFCYFFKENDKKSHKKKLTVWGRDKRQKLQICYKMPSFYNSSVSESVCVTEKDYNSSVKVYIYW